MSDSNIRASPSGVPWPTLNSYLSTVTLSIEELLQKPVIDETGLKERYDYELRWDPTRPESIVDAAREQLDLRLTPAKRPVEVLIVERAIPRNVGPLPPR